MRALFRYVGSRFHHTAFTPIAAAISDGSLLVAGGKEGSILHGSGFLGMGSEVFESLHSGVTVIEGIARDVAID